MPNWCWNSGCIRLPKDALPDAKEAFKKLAENNGNGWFGCMFPTPPEMNLGLGSAEGNQEYINLDWLRANSKFTGDFGTVKVHKYKGMPDRRELIPTKEYKDYLNETFSADNWYQWNLANWGTKWDVNPEIWGQDEESINFSFESAWGPAEQFFEELSDQYGLEYQLSYHESGARFAGKKSYWDGEHSEEHVEGDEYPLYVIKEFDEPIEYVLYELENHSSFDEFIEAESQYKDNPELLELIKQYYEDNSAPPEEPIKLKAVKASPAKKTAKKATKKTASKKKAPGKKKSPSKKKVAKKTTKKK